VPSSRRAFVSALLVAATLAACARTHRAPAAPAGAAAQPAATPGGAPAPRPATLPVRGTDIYLAPLSVRDGRLVVGTPLNVTSRPGYDNQPSFTPDGGSILYTSIREDGQADTYRYDAATQATTRLTRTPESEYSPTVLPSGDGFSVVRVERDSAQRLWRFAMDGGDPRLLVANVKPVGYHAWLDDHTVVVYVLGTPSTLQVVDVPSGRGLTVARDVGRSIQRIPGRFAVSFVQHVRRPGADSVDALFQLDGATLRADGALRPPPRLDRRNEFVAWTPDGRVLSGIGSTVVQWDTARGAWEEVAALAELGPRAISRLAVSPQGDRIALVVEEQP
jgi:hypothetical protein